MSTEFFVAFYCGSFQRQLDITPTKLDQVPRDFHSEVVSWLLWQLPWQLGSTPT